MRKYDIEKLMGRVFRIFEETQPNRTVGIMLVNGNKVEVCDELTIPELLREKNSEETIQTLADKAITM